MAVELDDWLIVNVYAPAGSNHKAERERFFEDLAPWLTNHISIVLAGDFNYVLNPARDRVKHRRKSTGPTESVMLERLKNRFDMTDAMNLVSHVEDEQDEHDPLNYYSYWKHDGASRLDRFYVTGEPYDQVQWVEAVEAAHDSDHREVRMELSSRGAGSNTEQSSVVYPIHTGRPQRVHDAIAAGIGKLMDTYETSKHPVKDWDGIITGLQRLLQDVKLADARQRKRYFANLRASTRNVFSSQAEIRTYEQEAGKRKATRSFGSNLQVSEENTRRFFKRNSDWQRDQTITRIVPSAGHFYSEDFPIEERMASEWSHVLSQSHATTSSSNYENEFNKFVRIPTEQQLTQNDAHRLVAPISEGETLDAIASLKRHKTAGTTGLNHDFYKDFAAELAPGLTLLFNAILNGEGVPESFLQATVVPLRKKGDSPDAMDYRPIALLNTAYKVFGRILADRLHCYLPRLISQSQQGFVRGRSIDKTITILKTILARSKADPLEAWTEAAMVLCLDLRKAYDTLDRNFMQQVLRRYGFSTKFIRVVHALHAGTTARFLVNGRTSQDWVVNSGIRQGCPLAPLLFILAVDTLGQAINRHPQLQGIPVPGSKAKRHKFSAFVDDSTVFLRSASELDTVTTILKQFGDLSGLRVQPSKSVIIGLNTVGAPTRWHGFPVQEPGATSRQLGYWVGNTAAIAENWKIRIEKTQRRLRIATKIGNSIAQRVQLFNVVALPGILFTGKQFVPPKNVIKQLVNLQKQFVERESCNWIMLSQTKSCTGVHPGLQDITRALRATRANLAEKWLQAPHDVYSAAWHAAAHPDQQTTNLCCTFRPTSENMIKIALKEKNGLPCISAQCLGKLELWTAHSGILDVANTRITNVRDAQVRDDSMETCTWINADTLHFTTPTNPRSSTLPPHPEFLLQAPWDNNAYVLDEKGKPLRQEDYPKLRLCRISDVMVFGSRENCELSVHSVLIRPPSTAAKRNARHKQNILRWSVNILRSVPWNLWGIKKKPPKPIALPTLRQKLQWEVQDEGERLTMAATHIHTERTTVLHLARNDNGITWRITWADRDFQESDDFQELTAWERVAGLTFESSPSTSLYPWTVPQGTLARNVPQSLRKQRTQASRRHLPTQLHSTVVKLSERANTSTWTKAAMQQSPKQLWDRNGLFTDFQNWTMYRIALGALNLRHSGWPHDRACPDPDCQCLTETIDHILWDCRKAETAWLSWINKWMGYKIQPSQAADLRAAAASRTAPPLQSAFLAKAQLCIGRWTPHHTDAMKLLWRIWATVTPALLWRLRNDAIFKEKITNERETTAAIKTAGDYQARAIASAWKQQPAKQIQGACLEICNSIMMALDEDDEAPSLDVWNIHFSTHTTEDKLTTGGWVLYHQMAAQLWIPRKAGSLYMGPTNTPTEAAARTLKQGLTELSAMTTPASTYLRIDGLDKKLQVQLQQLTTDNQETGPAAALAKDLGAIFSVQWGTPAGTALRASKLLAKTSTTIIYDTHSTGEALIPNSMTRKTIADSTPQQQKQQKYSKTVDIQTRLTTYQASIGQ